MADRVKKVNYTYVSVPNRPGQGTRMLTVLKEAGVNLVALHAFPGKRGNAQIDLVTPDLVPLRRVAKRSGWKLSAPKKCFIVQGEDRVGAVDRHLAKLAGARINVVATSAVTAGAGRYGMILWVRPKDYARAARALGAT